MFGKIVRSWPLVVAGIMLIVSFVTLQTKVNALENLVAPAQNEHKEFDQRITRMEAVIPQIQEDLRTILHEVRRGNRDHER